LPNVSFWSNKSQLVLVIWGYLISLELGLTIFIKKLNDKDLWIYLSHNYVCYKVWKVKNVFQKWVCSWYFCMKLWVINDIDINYWIPLVLTILSNLLIVCHSSNLFKGIMILFLWKKPTLKWKNCTYMKRVLCFFPFNFCLWT
jgi:hypothetical protein